MNCRSGIPDIGMDFLPEMVLQPATTEDGAYQSPSVVPPGHYVLRSTRTCVSNVCAAFNDAAIWLERRMGALFGDERELHFDSAFLHHVLHKHYNYGIPEQ